MIEVQDNNSVFKKVEESEGKNNDLVTKNAKSVLAEQQSRSNCIEDDVNAYDVINGDSNIDSVVRTAGVPEQSHLNNGNRNNDGNNNMFLINAELLEESSYHDNNNSLCNNDIVDNKNINTNDMNNRNDIGKKNNSDDKNIKEERGISMIKPRSSSHHNVVKHAVSSSGSKISLCADSKENKGRKTKSKTCCLL